MKRGNEIDLNFYTHDLRYSLSGSSAAIDQMLQCAGMGAPKPASKPVAARGPKVIYGSCKLIVDGVQYVNLAQGCPIWMDTDGTFWINTDRANFLAGVIGIGTGRRARPTLRPRWVKTSGWVVADAGPTAAPQSAQRANRFSRPCEGAAFDFRKKYMMRRPSLLIASG
jgi:hypothetical protein